MQIYMYAVMYVCNYVILYVCVRDIYIYIYIHMGVWNITKNLNTDTGYIIYHVIY